MSKKVEEILSDISTGYGVRRCRTIKNKAGQEELLSNRRAKIEEVFILIAKTMMEQKGKEFNEEKVQRGISAIVDYLSCTEGTIDPEKGILLKGNTGCGKTFLMEVLQRIIDWCSVRYMQYGKEVYMRFKIVDAGTMMYEYQKNPEIMEEYCEVFGLCIDDMGAENAMANVYGNKENVVSRVIFKREQKGLPTFATTNLYQFSDKYDARVISRMNSLFNVVAMENKDDFRMKR